MFSSYLTKEQRSLKFLEEITEYIEKGKIKNKEELEKQKIILAKKHGIFSLVKNAELIEYATNQGKKNILSFLRTKPVRTNSGVANIAVMWMSEISCPAKCIYCPQGDGAPKSYLGVEPATMRAKRFNYDPKKQVENRLKQFHILGHNTDKCELIIMGGTFTATPFSFQKNFIRECFNAFNGIDAETLEEAHKINETSKNRCIGLTIETRADYCSSEDIKKMLSLGCTRVEIGIQTTDDDILKKIKRGHNVQTNIDAIRRLKENGLKFTAHWMPGLTGLYGEIDIDKELKMFSELFTPEYEPDELKIYPVLVLHGTPLYELWKRGEYKALEKEEMIELLIKMKRIVPDHVRIKRIMRDISEHEAAAGTKTTNLRQLVNEMMKNRGEKCRCIRCREIGIEKSSDLRLLVKKYNASEGDEYFISVENENQRIIGFLRLRIDSIGAKIRELHVYGETTPIGEKISYQHFGIGKSLIEKAETIAKEKGEKEITVTSGVGVREYYKKIGYFLENFYMKKKI